ncbi:hypothetical protein VTK56DRAFT_3922 [Thermocarpiscus australiensis]
MTDDADGQFFLGETCGGPDEGPWSDVPRPLHITKRSIPGRENRTGRRSRCSSPEGDVSVISMDESPQESYVNDSQLSIRKRENRGCLAVCEPGGCATYEHTDEGVMNGRAATLSAHSIAPRRQRAVPRAIPFPSNSLTSCPLPLLDGSLLFPERGQIVENSVDHEDLSNVASPALPVTPEGSQKSNSPLRNTSSMFYMAPSPDPEHETGTPPTPGQAGSAGPACSRCQPCPTEPLVLVPRIVVTPEHEALDESAATLWATVELSTRVCPANASDSQEHDTACEWATGRSLGLSASETFRHGYLRDVSVEILPTAMSTIVEVLNNKVRAKSIFYPGSRLLVVVHVRLLPAARPQLRTHIRQSSDDLIEDLERHLGGTTTEYLQVRMTYQHSAFPHKRVSPGVTGNALAPDGIVSVQTTIQTTAVAAIKRHNFASPWSPHPPASQPNDLFEIITSHWGPDSAGEVMQRISRSRAIPRKAARTPRPLRGSPVLESASSLAGREEMGRIEGRIDERGLERKQRVSEEAVYSPPAPPSRAPPPIPTRQTSLRQGSGSSSASHGQCQQREFALGHDEYLFPHLDLATSIWREMLQAGEANETATPMPATTVRRKSHRRNRVRGVSGLQSRSSPEEPESSIPSTLVRSGKSASSTETTATWATARTEPDRRRGSRGRWSVGGDGAPVALTRTLVDSTPSNGRVSLQARRPEKMVATAGVAGRSSSSRKSSRDKGWGWAGWWK